MNALGADFLDEARGCVRPALIPIFFYFRSLNRVLNGPQRSVDRKVRRSNPCYGANSVASSLS